MYDYFNEMVNDVKDYIETNYNLDCIKEEFSDADEFEDRLNDELWNEDSVTGNGSGSYTFSRAQAKDYVTDNIDRLQEAIVDFGLDATDVAEHFLNEDWEYFDVTIRCNTLSGAINQALDELDIEDYFDDDEEG